MPSCPHCHTNGVGHWRKWFSGPGFPAACRHCGGLSYVPVGRSADILLLATLCLLGSGLLAALLDSGWPLLLGLLAGLATYIRRWQRSELIVTDQASTQKTQGRHAIINAIALLLASLFS